MISSKHVYEEIKSPKDILKEEEPPMLLYIYKAVYMCMRLLLDIRQNTNVQKDNKESRKSARRKGNSVIKDSDDIVYMEGKSPKEGE